MLSKILLNLTQGFNKIFKSLITLIVFTFFFLGITVSSNAQSSKTLTISYTDYNNILKGLVLDKGAPSRIAPKVTATPTGTRISYVSTKITRLEANRVMFHYLKEEDKITLHNARLDLEAFPAIHQLSKFSKNEQLAYWFNLRNLTVLDMVAQNYPLMKLGKFWREIENEKILNVSGNLMSINDVEALITTNWPRTQVIYGFYNGSIGGPNIRTTAYTGKSVWADLNQNAKEFVNSLRGIQFRRNTTRVSEHYKRYSTFFPNFDYDLRNHLLTHLTKNLTLKLQKTTALKATINDWNIADLMNGRLGLSSPGMLSPAAFIFGLKCVDSCGFKTSVIASTIKRLSLTLKYPAHVQAYLKGRQRRIREREGIVTIDEVEGNEKDVPTPKDNKKTKN